MTELRYVQTNLNHCRAAQDLLDEFARPEDIAVALVSEPQGGGRADWHYDSSGRAAVAVFRSGLTLGDVQTGDGFVAATVGGAVRAFSCYASPALSAAEFQQFLGRLEASVRSHHGVGLDLIVGGDFNARSASWGDRLTEARGDDLAAFAGSLGLIVLNRGRELTFFGRGQGSCVDVTLASESAAGKIRGWTVRTDVENMSDHHHLCFSYSTSRTCSSGSGGGWSVAPGLDHNSAGR
ncbi:uncharacterized protein LOC132952769 [Metopolophium dirhodum]|uniref:uncharacterized protein LOC132952769 n=1 Tax=Metopolophium dirhodum TaxID=44670 RepID=UPI00298F44E6|nr:uncharacterized protein LOC132952769 [Metopolophium dirhodum]